MDPGSRSFPRVRRACWLREIRKDSEVKERKKKCLRSLNPLDEKKWRKTTQGIGNIYRGGRAGAGGRLILVTKGDVIRK